jgi:hypothetical protein
LENFLFRGNSRAVGVSLSPLAVLYPTAAVRTGHKKTKDLAKTNRSKKSPLQKSKKKQFGILHVEREKNKQKGETPKRVSPFS